MLGTAALLAGCGPDDRPSDPNDGFDAAPARDAAEGASDATSPPDATVSGKVVVYAHSAKALYKIDPSTLQDEKTRRTLMRRV